MCSLITSHISSVPVEVLEMAVSQLPDWKSRAQFSSVCKLFNTAVDLYKQNHQEEYDAAKLKGQEIVDIRNLMRGYEEGIEQFKEYREQQLKQPRLEREICNAKILSLRNARGYVGPFKSVRGLLSAIWSNGLLAQVFPYNYLSAEIKEAQDEFDGAQKAYKLLKKEIKANSPYEALGPIFLELLPRCRSDDIFSRDEMRLLMGDFDFGSYFKMVCY